MVIDAKDRPIIRWALEKAYSFEYCRATGLPEPCLRVRLGLSRAYFHRGKLVHWSAESPGHNLDHLLQEMTSLFAACASHGAYLNAYVSMSPPDQVSMIQV